MPSVTISYSLERELVRDCSATSEKPGKHQICLSPFIAFGQCRKQATGSLFVGETVPYLVFDERKRLAQGDFPHALKLAIFLFLLGMSNQIADRLAEWDFTGKTMS